ncbi:hypothetical protein D7D25_09750 [Proteiniphilum sp. X52]|nr:hypothetical protein D7D25_09750 [Proteiniphilum sp. X52]
MDCFSYFKKSLIPKFFFISLNNTTIGNVICSSCASKKVDIYGSPCRKVYSAMIGLDDKTTCEYWTWREEAGLNFK